MTQFDLNPDLPGSSLRYRPHQLARRCIRRLCFLLLAAVRPVPLLINRTSSFADNFTFSYPSLKPEDARLLE